MLEPYRKWSRLYNDLGISDSNRKRTGPELRLIPRYRPLKRDTPAQIQVTCAVAAPLNARKKSQSVPPSSSSNCGGRVLSQVSYQLCDVVEMPTKQLLLLLRSSLLFRSHHLSINIHPITVP